MLQDYRVHNRFWRDLSEFAQHDPHLSGLSQFKYQYHFNWWKNLSLETPGIYILTGGRQIGKSTSCKQLIQDCLQKKLFKPSEIFYLPCDEIYDAFNFSKIIRFFLEESANHRFFLIIDEVTFVKDWDRVIKALADEGHFQKGLCLLTGSDTLILKEAAMRFPGRRGDASQIDFHLYPLSFKAFVHLVFPKEKLPIDKLSLLFDSYLKCGGYLRAINDVMKNGNISKSTYMIYEQWIRGDFLKQRKNENSLFSILSTLLTIGVSQISYSSLTQKIGLLSKETVIDYCHLLERMDVLINLQAFDQNKKQGFPRKARKFHFTDPFIYQVLVNWLKREGYFNAAIMNSTLVESTVASHCHRLGKTFYFKGQGEVDLIWLVNNKIKAVEVKWTEQLRLNDLKMLKQFGNKLILTKKSIEGVIQGVFCMPVYQFLYELTFK